MTAPTRTRDDAYTLLSTAAVALLERTGVCGVALVDGQGRLVLHVGEAPRGLPEAAVARLRAALAAAGVLGADAAPDASAFLLDGDHRVHAAHVAHGLVLMVFGDEDLWPGLAHRTVGSLLASMREAVLLLFDDAGPASSPR
ncbi:MAG: hypothetical protein IPI34_11620 [bacterium]|nr:hypothetical protein [bacterium]